MRQSSEHRSRFTIGKALATAAVALLCVAALDQPHAAYAHEGGGGFHGGGGGFHGGGGGFHGGGFHAGFGSFRDGGFHRFGGFRRDGFSGGGFYEVSPSEGYSDYAPTSQIWYYCADPAGYYPYVTQCSIDWQPVPAS
jgi:hypothetical protein